MDNQIQKKSFFLGVIFLIIGGFIFINNLHLIPDPLYWKIKNLFWHWPMILIIIGLFHVYLKEYKFPGALILLIGLFFMLPHWFFLPFNFKEIFWPTIFIIAGLTILLKGGHHKRMGDCWKKGECEDQDLIDDLNFFGGSNKIITSQNFKGGKISCVFGGINYNMLKAKLSSDKNEIEVIAVFGGLKLVVPEEWEIKINVTSVFGGFVDKRNISPSALQNKNGEIVIKGITIFGGGEIKNF